LVVGYLVAGIVLSAYLAREYEYPSRTEIIILILVIFTWGPALLSETWKGRRRKKEKSRERGL